MTFAGYRCLFRWAYILLFSVLIQPGQPTQVLRARCLGGFLCDGDRCLDNSKVCDKNFDCIDRSDEQHCSPCKLNEIRCSNRMCISRSALCDHRVDCPNGEDEQPSFCLAHKCPHEFLCQVTLDTCVTEPCSGQAHCADYSDQAPEICLILSRPHSNITCQANQFTCQSGDQCIHEFFRCDGIRDCKDGSDETPAAGCSSITETPLAENEFVCSNGQTIPREWVCDQKADCPDGEDEAIGLHTQSQCSALNVSRELRTCPLGTFACGQTHTFTAARCLPENRVCDGLYDCDDLSDELSCADPCAKHNQFTCHMGRRYRGKPKCVPFESLCNGHADCPVGDDELVGPRTNCTKSVSCAQNNGGCSQLCSVVNGQVKCDCTPGYLTVPGAPRSCIARGDRAILYTAQGQLYQRLLGKNITRVLQFGMGPSRSNASVLIPTVQWKLAPDTTDSTGASGELWRSLVDFDYTFERADLTGLSESLSLVLVHRAGLFDTSAFRFTASSSPSRKSMRLKRHQTQYLHPLAVHPDFELPHELDRSNQGVNPLALAYDWVHDLVYWTNGTSRIIHVTHRASGWSKRLLQLQEGNQPLGIAVDPRFAKLYWITRGRQSMIETMDMDGQNRKTLVTEQLRSPYSIAMDYIQNELYWADGPRGSVEAYNLGTQTRRTVVQSGDYYPVWIAVFEDWVYWSDRKQNALFRAHKMTGADPESMFAIPDPLSFRLQHDLLRPIWVNRCARHACQQLCLPIPLRAYPNYSSPFVCACADGWEVDSLDPTRCRQLPTNSDSSVDSAMVFSPVDVDAFWQQRASLLRDWIGYGSQSVASASTTHDDAHSSFIPMAILIALLAVCMLALGVSYIAFRNYRRHLNKQLDAHLSRVRLSEAKSLLTSGPSNQSMDSSRPWSHSSAQIVEIQAHGDEPRVQFHMDSSAVSLNQRLDSAS